MKKQYLYLAATLASLAIAGCGPTKPADTGSSETASSTPASSSNNDVSNSSYAPVTYEPKVYKEITKISLTDTAPTGYKVEDVYANSKTIKVEATYKDGTTAEVTNVFNTYWLQMTDGDGKAVSPATAFLKAGTYKVHAQTMGESAYVTSDDVTVTVAANDAPVGYYKAGGNSMTYNRLKLWTGMYNSLPTGGHAKVLVVPVDFKGYRGTDAIHSDIEKAFFGKAEETGWQSLKSYYDTSSYGRMTLEGAVTPWFHYAGKPETFAALTLKNSGLNPTIDQTTTYDKYYDPTWTLLQQVTTWAKNSKVVNLQDYDTDNDGMVDGVWMIYNHGQTGTNPWWNYTYYNYINEKKANIDNPCSYHYCWSSIESIHSGYYSSSINIDAHTIIHESGHLMGLDDYYDSKDADGKSGKESPCGGVDMMDQNVGDHDAFSKFAFGWNEPYVVDGLKDSVTISLNSFTESGDFILVRDADNSDPWNGSPFDEYLMIQLSTPTGLNEKDSVKNGGYPEWSNIASKAGTKGIGPYEKVGLQIFHVDARVVGAYSDDLTATSPTFTYSYADLPQVTPALNGDTKGWSTGDTVASNSPGYSGTITGGNYNQSNGANRLINAIDAAGTNRWTNTSTGGTDSLPTYYSRMGVDNVLFAPDANKTFSMAAYGDQFFPNKTTFNDGSTFGYTVTVDSISDTNVASVTIAKVA